MPDPSILIAFGPYGLRVLRNFLASAATRGALAWDEQGGVGTLNERRLQTLSLFWIPNRVEFRQNNTENLQAENSYELMDDLYRQIEMMGGTFEEIRSKLVTRIDAEKNRLLDAGRHGEADMPGLDVFIIAQPTSQDMIGLVRNLMEPAMEKLNADPAFVTAQGTRLHFIQIFDFDDYWSSSMDAVRRSLRRMTEEGADAIVAGRSAAGRVYLFDGNTPAGRRHAASRQQEVVLFLELLLLEGLRALPDARALYERQNLGVPPVCSIGVRVVERSSGLLLRLAAAAFARGWLEFLGSIESMGSPGSPFAEMMQPFLPENLSRTAGEPYLRKLAATEIAAIETAMLELPYEDGNWLDSLRGLAALRTEDAILKLSRPGANSGENNSRDTPDGSALRGALKQFRTEIEQTITAAMQTRHPRMTLGTMIEQLGLLENQFVAAAVTARPSEEPPAVVDAPFEEADQMHREYCLYRLRQVQTADLKRRWWPMLAILFALAFSPVLAEGIANSPLNGLVPALGIGSRRSIDSEHTFLAIRKAGPAPYIAKNRGTGA